MKNRSCIQPHAIMTSVALIGALTFGCSSQGSQFEQPPGSSGGTANTTSTGGTGNTMSTGGTGNTTSTGGTGGAPVMNGGTGGGTGGSTTGGSDAGGTGGTGPVCPKPSPEICHEFIANDNARNVVNYVNEFTGATWTAPVNVTGVNSPRTIEIVDNAKAQTGKAVLVSLNNGYAEFDLVDGTKVGQVTVAYTGITAACRLPDGNTALGTNTQVRIVSNTGAAAGSFNLPTGDDLRAITRHPETGNYWFSKTQLIYEVNDQGIEAWKGDMGTGTKGYVVWWRDGGGAYASTGAPSTVIEMNADGTIVNTVGGKEKFDFLDFFSGFVRLPNGNFVVANWLGHLAQPDDDAPHVVEFTPANEVVWQWGNQTLARQITNVYVFQ